MRSPKLLHSQTHTRTSVIRAQARIADTICDAKTHPPEQLHMTLSQVKAQKHVSFLDEVLQEWTGNLFSSHGNLAHCVSSDTAMHAGIAKQFRRHFPAMRNTIAQILCSSGNLLPYYDHAGKRWVYNLVTKHAIMRNQVMNRSNSH